MRKLVVGLTGGIASGKSVALAEFARLGAAAVSLDELSRELCRRGAPLHRRLARAFGPSALKADGELDRPALAAKIFKSPALRRRLERLTHPALLAEMRRRVAAARPGVVVVDVPLLFEGGHQGRFDLTLSVGAPERERLRRLRRRDRLTAAEARRRLAAQLPEARRRALADLVVDNDRAPAAFRARIRQYYRAFDLISRSAP